MGRRLSPEDRERIAAEKEAERRRKIREIVDQAPPLSMQQFAIIDRVFTGFADWARQRAAEKAAERAAEGEAA